MLNSTIQIKVKERLNKLDSQDYDNINCWQISEAFNKAQVEWVRCDKRRMTVYLAEEENLNQLLRDKQKQPSFEWAETFATLIGNTTHIYTNGEFEVESANLIYYRQPRRIQIQGCTNPYDNTVSAQNIESEFKDDIVELIIDEAVSIIAGDIESGNQFSRGTETAERNN
jgi:hypothetical protein